MLKYLKRIVVSLLLLNNYLQSMEHKIERPSALHNMPQGITKYLENLPQIKNHARENIGQKSEDITEFLCAFSNSKKELVGKPILAAKIKHYLAENEPVRMILLGFPSKSSNDEKKVLTTHIDCAELVALLSLHHICNQIKIIHKPGCRITIYSREPFISQMNVILKERLDIQLLSDDTVEQYQSELQKLTQIFYPTIEIGKIDDISKLYENKYQLLAVNSEGIDGYTAFMKEELDCSRYTEAARKKSFNENRQHLLEKYQLHEIKTLDDLKKDQKKYKQVLTLLPIKPILTNAAISLAECAAEGAVRMRALMNENIPDYQSFIRLSIHSTETGDVSNKLGINLIYGSQGTPWHRTLVSNQKGVALESLAKLSKSGQLNGRICKYPCGELQLAYVEQ